MAALGQHFIIDPQVVKRIADAASVRENDIILEIGPGTGNLTVELAKRAGFVIAVEKDDRLIDDLKVRLKNYANILLIPDDILKFQLSDLLKYAERIKIVANIPYYITTPLIMKLLASTRGAGNAPIIEEMVLTIQKEAALRLTARPGSKEYGLLSVTGDFYSDSQILFDIGPECFRPAPHIVSSVVKIKPYDVLPYEINDVRMFFRVVKASFIRRRKTLANALASSGSFRLRKEEIIQILNNAGIQDKQRGETLSYLKFIEIANSFSAIELLNI